MEVTLNLIPWCFGSIMVLGVGYLLITLVFGEVAEAAGGLLEGVEGTLEGLGLELFPETAAGDETGKGISCGLIAAFLAGFGVLGTLASLFGAGAGISILAALVSGIFFGGLYFAFIGFLTRQEASTALKVSDLIGSTARVTTNTPAGQTGEAFLEVRSQRKRYPIRELHGQALARGDLVQVERLEGGTLFVVKLWSSPFDEPSR